MMKIFTQMKTLALTAGLMLFTTSANAADKPSSGDIVVSKVFYAASKGTESGNYAYGQYIELYNNSANDIDVTGLYIGLIESETKATAYTIEAIEADADLHSKLNGKVVLKQVFQLPTEGTTILQPGKSILVCNSAINHTALAVVGHDLSGADYEVKTTNAKYAHNADVPALTMAYSFNSSTDFMNLSYAGPAGVVLLKNDTKAIDFENPIYARGKDKGSQYVIANLYYCVDAVDILANNKSTGIDATTKRLNDTNDKGYASTATGGTYNGETVYRKTAYILPDGRKVLYDTNNSSVDFQSSSTIQPRAYDEELSGVTEGSITIPETGFLVFRPEKCVYGDSDLTFTYVTANAKNTDLTYNEFKGTDELLASSNFIVIGQPGTHKVFYSEAQASKKIPSSVLTWCEEDSKELTGSQKTRSIYKWVCTAEKVGFQRVPKTTEGLYNVATFSGDDRLYLTLTTTMVDAFYVANDATSAEAFDFIKWHGTTPTLTGIQAVNAGAAKAAAGVKKYVKDGRLVIENARGIFTVAGVKVK